MVIDRPQQFNVEDIEKMTNVVAQLRVVDTKDTPKYDQTMELAVKRKKVEKVKEDEDEDICPIYGNSALDEIQEIELEG